RLSLFCLVDGNPQSNVFSVKPTPADAVDDLEKLIKAEKTPHFDDVAADELSLWPQSPHCPRKRSTSSSSAFLQSLRQRQPVLPFLAQLIHGIDRVLDHIEQEPVIFFNGVQYHHAKQPLDPKELEMSQKEQLGPFFKRTLPYHRTAKNISLVMLGLELDKQAKASDGKTTLRFIVEDDIGAFSGNRAVAIVALSGSGKTATVIDLATKHFVVYCICSTPRAIVFPNFNYPNFVMLAKDVEKMYMAVFFREQTTTGGASTIGALVNKVREYDTNTIQAMFQETQTELHSVFVPRRLGLVIAVDEAQIATNDILAGKLISPSALIDSRDNKDTIFDGKSQVQLKRHRGFLTPLSAILSSMQATLAILGTALSLQNADQVYSALDKISNFIRIIASFPQFDASDVNKMISDLVDL
ncbi:hypothetical protein BG015_003663, partial [Linnemannia schmuckeri]